MFFYHYSHVHVSIWKFVRSRSPFNQSHWWQLFCYHLQNGWYFAKTTEVKNYTICASFLIKSDYSYENRDLINTFSPELPLSYAANVSLELEKGKVIKNLKGEEVFALVESDFHAMSHLQSLSTTLLLVLMISIWLYWLSKVSPV